MLTKNDCNAKLRLSQLNETYMSQEIYIFIFDGILDLRWLTVSADLNIDCALSRMVR